MAQQIVYDLGYLIQVMFTSFLLMWLFNQIDFISFQLS